MNNCLECGSILNHIEGRRKKKFCDDKCRAIYWQKNHKPKNESKIKAYLKKMLEDNNIDDVITEINEDIIGLGICIYEISSDGVKRINPLSDEGQNIIKQSDEQKQIDIKEEKHKLWKTGDPKECSGAFFLKYDCYTYKELENKLK